MSKPAIQATESTLPSSATPMMRQYLEVKSSHPDAIVFYRLGDFYEMFFEDAQIASKLLDLTLTTRGKNDDNPIPMCGVPHHASESYLAKLIELGRKVVICEQVEDAKFAKGLVRREVTRIVTPGTVHEAVSLDASRNNFLLCLTAIGDGFVASLCDITTGKLEYFELGSADKVRDEIARLDVREVIYPEAFRGTKDLDRLFGQDRLYHHAVTDVYFDLDYAQDLIKRYWRVAALEALDLKDVAPELSSLGGLMGYLEETKLLKDGLIAQPVRRKTCEHLFLDETTTAHLEIFRTARDGRRHGSLFWHLDACATPMGSRKLSEILAFPLFNATEINARLNGVEEFTTDALFAENALAKLSLVSDLERLANRFVLGSGTPRDALSLATSLDVLPELKIILTNATAKILKTIAERLLDFGGLTQKIRATVKDDAPLSTKDGGVIQDGVSAELDELRRIQKSGKDFILALERREKELTGISSLKIRYNNVFGYYIEITNAHKDKAPENYVRKQTLANAERYITSELKDYEAKVLGASERIRILETELFAILCDEVKKLATEIKSSADAVALLDVLQGFAHVARKFHYVRPRITSEILVDLKGARHPILERLNPGSHFVPNDIYLDAAGPSEIIITGPNMAGKSTLMRMVALTCLMGQAGSFVPCDKATLGLADRIFTRVGAHDHLQKGLSTFMVEMVETAKILREATPRSLIFLDEIGRGTSTFDGLSIAWAVAEDLHDRLRARTLFATHYHELCDLSEERKGIKNYHMAVKEWNGEIIFLRKLSVGGTNRSYGVVVAGMAGLPESVIKRAKGVLKLLELKDLSFQNDLSRENSQQMSLFQSDESAIIKELKNADVNAMTPLEALNFLAALKTKA